MQINGIPVKDAKRPLSIHITKRDLKLGDPKSPGNCAIARALKRQPDVNEAKVYLSRTFIRKGDKWYRFNTPNSLRTELIQFDRSGVFTLGEYHIPVVPVTHSLGKPRKHGKRTKGSGKPRPYHQLVGVRERCPGATGKRKRVA